jgi:zinc/manganese transport system substrate-binding protein
MMQAGKVVLSVVAACVIAGVGVWGGVYHFALGTSNPCAGITTPTSPPANVSFEPSVLPSSPTAAPMLDPATASTREPSPGPSLATSSAATPTTSPHAENVSSASSPVINVVAGENFWGNLVSQIGGAHVSVTSVISDPNTDPHEYQQNDSVQKAIANAQYVILNNVGYDSWGTLDVEADDVPGQVVLNIGDSLGVQVTGGIVTGNPHLWYNPTYVNDTVRWMYDNLSSIAPSLQPYFESNYNNTTASLATLYSEVGIIRHEFAGTVVASTESIFVYLANATGLNLVSPPAFMEAIAEGNDPPDQSIVQFQCQLESGNVHVLVFNAQTVTPITTDMKSIAAANNVSIISVTETMQPINVPTTTFQSWMGGEYNALWVALDAKQLGE